MTPIERAGWLAHARTDGFRRRIESAREIIADGLAQCSRPYVAFSAGKDSSAMLALVRDHAPGIESRILTSGESRLMHPALDQVLAWWREAGANVHEIHIDHLMTGDGTFDEQRAGRVPLRNEPALAANCDGVFVGIRASESRVRRIAIARWGVIHRYRGGGKRGITRVAPVAWLTTADVGAIIAEREIPLVDAYERHGMETRTTMRFTDVGIQRGVLDSLQMENPTGWERLIARFPELSWLG